MMVEGSMKARITALAREYPGLTRSALRRRAKALPKRIDALQAAVERVAETDLARMKEHERRFVRPKQVARKAQIDRLFDAGSINERQHRAAQKLLELYQDSGFEPRVIAAYDTTVGYGAGMIGSGPKAREYSEAMQAVGMVLSPVLVVVVFYGWSPSQWAANKGYPRNYGMPMLHAALDMLAAHFEGRRRRP
jgi:hypothetical protein